MENALQAKGFAILMVYAGVILFALLLFLFYVLFIKRDVPEETEIPAPNTSLQSAEGSTY